MQAHDVLALVVKDDDRNTPAEMLEVLTDTEEVRRQRICKQEILHLVLHLGRAGSSIIRKPSSVADFSIEHLASGKRLVFLYHVQNVIGHFIIATPRHVLCAVGERNGRDVYVILEHLATVRNEERRTFSLRHLFHGRVANLRSVSMLIHKGKVVSFGKMNNCCTFAPRVGRVYLAHSVESLGFSPRPSNDERPRAAHVLLYGVANPIRFITKLRRVPFVEVHIELRDVGNALRELQ